MNESVPENGAQAETARPSSLADRVRSLRIPEGSGRRSSGFSWLPWVLCLVLALSTGFFAVRAYDRPAEQAAPQIQNALQQNLGTPAAQRLDEVALKSKGYILPVQQIQVSPKVGGMVLKLNFKEGTRV